MDFPLPPVGEGLFEVELTRWLVGPGDAVARGQALAEVMSDKATMEVPAPFAGTVTAVVGTPGDKLKVGELLLRYTPAGEAVPAAPVLPGSASVVNGAAPPVAAVPARVVKPAAAPSVRLLARKLGVDLARVAGTGPNGRVLLDDLTPHFAPPAAGGRRVAPAPSEFGVAGTRVKLVGLRRKIAEQMVAAKRTAPHYTYVDECDLTDLVRLRNQLKEPFAAAGVKLTYLPFVVKAVTRALKEVPAVNGFFDAAVEEMVLAADYHIGVAVAGPNGLVVPVIRHADRKDVAAIATEIDRLSTDVRAGRPELADLGGGTFTVTSIGGIGGLLATPILNTPEVGILSVGKVVRRPVYDAAGAVRPADMVYLSFSFDHRFVDGAVGVAFGNAVIRHLQAPATLLLADGFGR